MPKKKPKRKEKKMVGVGKRSRAPLARLPTPEFLDRARSTPPAVILEEGLTQLGRATDALVHRVVNSAREGSRDPAEHVLDLSRAYYQEETATGQHNIQCDRCLLKSPGASSVKAASKLAESLGWVVTESFDHCPVCRDGSKLLKGGSAVLQPKPALTPSDMILIVRMRFILDAIAKGMSVEAFLQNSVRSQHRSMLSDLAQETNYDTAPLIARVTTLIGQRNADVHALFMVDAGKVWTFFRKLYDALKLEDQPDPASPS